MPNYGHLSLSCAKIERPSPLRKPSCKVRLFAPNRSRKYRQKVTITTLFQTASYPDFQLPSQTPHACFHRQSGYTLAFRRRIAHNGLHGETGAFPLSATAQSCAANRIALNAAFATLDSATLLYTYISRFSVTPHYQQQLYLRPPFVVFFNLSHKRPTFASTCESGYTLGFRRKIAHNGSHAETGGVSDGGAITTLDTYCTFTNIPGPGVRTAYFAALGSWLGGALEERREPSEQ